VQLPIWKTNKNKTAKKTRSETKRKQTKTTAKQTPFKQNETKKGREGREILGGEDLLVVPACPPGGREGGGFSERDWGWEEREGDLRKIDPQFFFQNSLLFGGGCVAPLFFLETRTSPPFLVASSPTGGNFKRSSVVWGVRRVS
jgi:hypothetical protein